MSRAVGIDFGATNGAVAVADDGGAVTLLSLPAPDGGVTSTWRTILYFESGEYPGQVLISAGAAAIECYAESGGQGRLTQSIKEPPRQRMTSALALAGFDDVSFEYEPVAAARRYAARLDHEELVVIADFGGGTSDFSVARRQ